MPRLQSGCRVRLEHKKKAENLDQLPRIVRSAPCIRCFQPTQERQGRSCPVRHTAADLRTRVSSVLPISQISEPTHPATLIAAAAYHLENHSASDSLRSSRCLSIDLFSRAASFSF